MNIANMMKQHGLFVAPLSNGDWMVGKASYIYHLNVCDDHYKDKYLTIAPTLPEAISKWIKTNK